MQKIALEVEDKEVYNFFKEKLESFEIEMDQNSSIIFCYNNKFLSIKDKEKDLSFCVDFSSVKLLERFFKASLKTEEILKTVNKDKVVVDATAGFGRDSFILSSISKRVFLIERNPIIYLLLEDGLNRAHENNFLLNMELLPRGDINSLSLKILEISPDMIFLDPMYPKKIKKSSSKKELQFLQNIVGEDLDSNYLLEKALELSLDRVVVKRPNRADYFNGIKPNFVYQSKNHRFDVYKNFKNN
ncbi:MAG: class I SAM-dependent methyltransferase [Psittacicella sp.]